VDQLKSAGRIEAGAHRKVYRPWGVSESIHVSDRFKVNRLKVRPGARISLQKHDRRAEHWIIVRGTALVHTENDQFVLKEDESTFIPAGTTHRLENTETTDIEIIEIQTGDYLGEDDIERFEDDYGRRNDD
jgi:mannose-1-phosphate guanylyltransferase/mannose-6-phosphate isomerase